MSKLNAELLLNDLKLQKLDTVEAVRRQGQAFALNPAGQIIAVSATQTPLSQLIIGEEAQELEHLYLAGNEQLSELRFEMALPKLKHLYVNDCKLRSLHLPKNMSALKQLYVQENELETLTFEGDCGALELLDASGNKLETLGMGPGFHQMKYLYLLNNQLHDLPDCLAGMQKMEMLLLAGNPLPGIPLEIVGSGATHNSAKEIVSYLHSIQGKNTRYLHEAKMILVGNPMVGKSSIRIKLNNPEADLPKQKDRTLGLDRAVYWLKDLPGSLTGAETPIDFQLNIWDFGGQGRYREIQQLFCSRKSLYLYVTSYDDQPEKEDYIGLDYWMSMVNTYSYDELTTKPSPVIYVLNKVDVQDDGIDEKSTRERYPNLATFSRVSCAEYRGFDQLIDKLRQTLPVVSSDMFSNRYNLDWFRVKERLAKLPGHHLCYGDYLQICQEEGLSVNDAETWLTALDRIGSVIYTGNFKMEQEWIILNANWVKDAICMVIDSPLMQRDGILRTAYFDAIWPDYPDPQDRENLVRLMLDDKYKLAYAIPSNEGETDYMVPSALFKKPKPSFAKFPYLENPANFSFEFRFEPFIPAGIVNKLMVTLNQHVYNNLIWGNGCVLHDAMSNTFIVLEEDWQKRLIRAEIIGTQAQAFYEKLQHTLEALKEDIKNSRFLHHLDAVEWMKFEGDFIEVNLLKKFGRFPWKDGERGMPGGKEPKNSAEEIQRIRAFIAKGKLKEALNQLNNLAIQPKQGDTLLVLESRLFELEDQKNQGIISAEQAGLEWNRIKSSLISMCNELS